MGGEAIYYGKPYEAVFERALRRAREHGPARRPLVIGDGIGTDILGAQKMGWDALFIAAAFTAPSFASIRNRSPNSCRVKE